MKSSTQKLKRAAHHVGKEQPTVLLELVIDCLDKSLAGMDQMPLMATVHFLINLPTAQTVRVRIGVFLVHAN